jgi:hypothetical protein
MPCPNCGYPDYTQGTRCDACQWQPANDPDLLQKERAKREEKEGREFKENLLAAFCCLLFFLFIFWFFPSGRRATDWFELTLWESVWALLLSTIAFSALFKK